MGVPKKVIPQICNHVTCPECVRVGMKARDQDWRDWIGEVDIEKELIINRDFRDTALAIRKLLIQGE